MFFDAFRRKHSDTVLDDEFNFMRDLQGIVEKTSYTQYPRQNIFIGVVTEGARTAIVTMAAGRMGEPLRRRVLRSSNGDTRNHFVYCALVSSETGRWLLSTLASRIGALVSRYGSERLVTDSEDAMTYLRKEARHYLRPIFGKGATVEDYRRVIEILLDGFSTQQWLMRSEHRPLIEEAVHWDESKVPSLALRALLCALRAARQPLGGMLKSDLRSR